MIRSRVIGTGSYLPVRVVPNDEIAPTLKLSPARIQRLTGIRTRHWAGEHEASSDMAIEAGRRALDAADCRPSSIEAIILSTTSPDMMFPSTACLVQRGLGCKQVGAFDVSASCSGFLYGLSMAQAMIQSGQVRTCLVVASEVKSRSLDPQDDATALLFGDGAGAVILRGEEDGTPEWRASVIERYGNTSSASLPIALDDAVRGGNISPNDLVLLGTFGGGATWATGLLRW